MALPAKRISLDHGFVVVKMTKNTISQWISIAPERSIPIASFINIASPTQKPLGEAVVKSIQLKAAGLNPPDVLGTSHDVQAIGHESLLPALAKMPVPEEQPRVMIGSSQCKQPYQASYLNCSALSFGPMGKKFILSLNRAAHQAGFYQNTGEAGLSPYHLGIDIDIEALQFNAHHFFSTLKTEDLIQAGDLVWQLGNGYFGCRKEDGSFDSQLFQQKSLLPPVKMIEIKLSQGVEPAAKMPVKEVTSGIASLMGINLANQAVLQTQHASFTTPIELLQFVEKLRNLSGGKPVGIKMGISHRHYFLAICKAMRQTGIFLDFVTVDGMEAGTAAAQAGTLGFTGTCLNDAIVFVHNALNGCKLRSEVKIIASGHIFSETEMVSALARGADLFATARGMMLAVGCDQQLECYKGTCPRGIATQDPLLLKNFNTDQNTERLIQYHQQTIQGLKGLIAIAGLSHPSQLKPFHLQKRISVSEVIPLDEVYEFVKAGSLLTLWPWQFPKRYQRSWRQADPAATFATPL